MYCSAVKKKQSDSDVTTLDEYVILNLPRDINNVSTHLFCMSCFSERLRTDHQVIEDNDGLYH